MRTENGQEHKTCGNCGENIYIEGVFTHSCPFAPPLPPKSTERAINRSYDDEMSILNFEFEESLKFEPNSSSGAIGERGYATKVGISDERIYNEQNGGMEGDYMNNLDSSLRNPPKCKNCAAPVYEDEDGFEIEVLGGWYHASCFVCVECNVPFSDENPFVPKDGNAYCERHYERRFLPNCAACEKPITDDKISMAFGKTFHEKHLCCSVCKERIQNPHIEYNGKVFCQKDFKNISNLNCINCGEKINGPSLAACGGAFHRECFACTTCKRSFPDKKYYVFENRPYCLLHYHEQSNTLCGHCREPISGQCVEVQEINKLFHPNCWCCAYCERKLTDVYFSFRGKAYCEDDIDLVYRTAGRNNQSDSPILRNTLMRSGK